MMDLERGSGREPGDDLDPARGVVYFTLLAVAFWSVILIAGLMGR